MRVLITNDDGIDSVGLHRLAAVAVAAGLEVTVAAPHEERSGASAALSALESDGRLIIEERVLPGLPDVTAYAVHASPAMMVFVGARGAFGPPPELVLSGINQGPNTGRAVLHSGTVGAACTAVSQGIPGLAFSLASSKPTEWDTAADVTAQALALCLPLVGSPIVVSVNIPDIAVEKLRGLQIATLANFGAVQAEVGEHGSGYVTMTFAEIDGQPEPGTDVALLRDGWATMTALDGPSSSDAVELPELVARGADGWAPPPAV